MGRWMDEWVDGRMGEWVDVLSDRYGQMFRWMDGWLNKWIMDGPQFLPLQLSTFPQRAPCGRGGRCVGSLFACHHSGEESHY